MLQVSNWVRIVVALILTAGLLIAFPNVLPDKVRDRLPQALQSTISLGLDLQGRSYLRLEVELDQVQKDQLESLMGDLRVGLRKAHIGFNGIAATGDSVTVHIIDPAQFEQAKTIVQGLNSLVGTSMLAVGTRDYDVNYPGNGTVTMRMSDAFKRN